jgi:hypothetical protein
MAVLRLTTSIERLIELLSMRRIAWQRSAGASLQPWCSSCS